MLTLTLKRFSSSFNGVRGVILDGDMPLALTLELPWRNNLLLNSCIPSGSYTCVKHKSPKHGDTFLLIDVPNRSNILIHSGNCIADTKGCILIGSQFSNYTLLSSKSCLSSLLKNYSPRFNLLIQENK